MTGLEIAVGYLFGWAVRKSRRVAGRADAEVDRGLDAGMDRLHELVSHKLGQDSALHRLTEEAEAGQEQPSDRTRQRVQLALEDAAEQDAGFAEALERAVEQLTQLQAQAPTAGGVSAGDGGQAVGGNVAIDARHGSVAAVKIAGNVTLGGPAQPEAANPSQPASPQG
ncbi:flagellar hook-basal body complex protein FliE [Kitasatospora sp. GAS204A]|nr:flagellar hook-basal body complex protein FliE [Kitasatospora sp. GAS204B]